MTIQNAINYFESLKIETTKKSENKIYDKFIHILSQLKKREFSKDETLSIETELDGLKLESNYVNRKKHFKKALDKLEKYLKENFSLTTKGYYTYLGTAFGMSLGMFFGLIFLSNWERSMGISLGMMFGMFIGLAIGRSMDAKAVPEGRAL